MSGGLDAGEALACYSRDYFEARERFREAARLTGATLHAHALSAEGPDRERLWIDSAVFGPSDAPLALVLSSGVHGVEAAFGSAVLLAWLTHWSSFVPMGLRVVLLNSLNPYGEVHGRRVNEDNVDLNRNFLSEGEVYSGAPPLYGRIDRYLNPKRTPSKWDQFAITVGMMVMRYGRRKLFETIPVGQYEFPKGLFFGGFEACESTKYVQRWLPEFIGDAETVLHIDLHTGLGKRGDIGLYLEGTEADKKNAWTLPWKSLCHYHAAQQRAGEGLYVTRGSLELWVQKRFSDRDYRFATLEAGTQTPYRILEAMRAENQAFHYGGGSPHFRWAQNRLAHYFAPTDPDWRRETLLKTSNLLWEMTNNLRIGE